MLLFRRTPALIWRAFFISALAVAPRALAAPPNTPTPPSSYLQFGEPDQAEGRAVLAAFRQAGIPGEYFFQFDIRVMPRRGDERTLSGKLWGSRNDEGPITRVAVQSGANERRLLIQNGPDAKVWSVDLGGGATTTRIVDSFEALVPGVELTAFELQMPYLYWPDARLERVSRIRSRPAHVFFFTPPAAWAAQHPEIAGVRAYLDTQFNVPVQSELIGKNQRVIRTLSLVDLAKVGDQYIPKSIDLRNEQTRDKVRFQVTGAALQRSFKRSIFEPASLTDTVESPAVNEITRIAR